MGVKYDFKLRGDCIEQFLDVSKFFLIVFVNELFGSVPQYHILSLLEI